MNQPLTPYYYLDNFCFLVTWVHECYTDLLSAQELAFIENFYQLDHHSQCLLVRMISRKGLWFRASKLNYAEIDHLHTCAQQLVTSGFISDDNPITIIELAENLTKSEMQLLFDDHLRPYKYERKEILTHILADIFAGEKTWLQWTGNQLGKLYRLDIQTIVDTLLLLFFGNPHQDLTEFVLQDLGLLRYEKYSADKQYRIFKQREDILQYQHLILLREKLFEAADLDVLIHISNELPDRFENPTMERRRARLFNQLAYEFERAGENTAALQLYQQIDLPPARERRIRLLEKSGQYQQAWHLLSELVANPVNEHELQIAERMTSRLAKKVGAITSKKINPAIIEKKLLLPQLANESGEFFRVEEITRRHFHRDNAPCFHAENELLNGLLGLWLWPEMFRNVEGAFANPFQTAPLDLYHDDFQKNRPGLQQLWQLFDEQNHGNHIQHIWQQKCGIANPFINWQWVDEQILQLALQCIPAQHLKLIFQRLLFDIRANRSGLPDLIQFFPTENTYRMIEVKGPGDRLQDNQKRWLDFFNLHNIPAEVCYVSWQ